MNIVVGVSGGIAAYKTCAVVSSLVKAGHAVRVMMTRSATQFVGPETFRSLTGQYVATRLFDARCPWSNEHIALADWAERLAIAPATASLLGKLAHGITDDLVACAVYATKAPVILAPAMNDVMWAHPMVQKNVAALKEIGYRFVDPGVGRLACGREGTGRMAEPTEIVDAILGADGR